MKDTNYKGDVGLLKVCLDLKQKGYEVFLPIGNASVVDAVAVKEDKTVRLQIKHKKITESTNTVNIPLYTVHNSKDGSVTKAYDLSEFDYFAVYVPEKDVIIYIPTNSINSKTSFCIRFEKPKNNQLKGVILADNYLNI